MQLVHQQICAYKVHGSLEFGALDFSLIVIAVTAGCSA